MFLARSLLSVVTFCSDRPPFKMAAVTKNRNFFNCPVVLEKKFVLHISHWVAMLTYVPRWWPSWDFQSVQKVATLG
jgi:hypothetical protein